MQLFFFSSRINRELLILSLFYMEIKQKLALLKGFEVTEKMCYGTCGCHTNLYGKGTWQPILKTNLDLYKRSHVSSS